MKKTKGFKKVVAGILAVVTTLTLALTGCGAPNNEEVVGNADNKKKERTLTLAGWGTIQEKKNFADLVRLFEETHPGVKVNYQHYCNASREYNIKLVANLSRNKLPDVFYLETKNYRTWAEAGRLMDLTDYVEGSEEYKAGNIWDRALEVYRVDEKTLQPSDDGKIYALPKDLGPYAMIYNKDLFIEKGVPLPDPEKPMTWTQFVETAKKFVSGTGINKIYGCANYDLATAVWSNGGDFLSEDKKTVTVDTPEFAEALQWVVDLANVHGVAPNQAEAATNGWFERFCNGKVAMGWMGAWQQSDLWEALDFEWDIMPTPVSDKTGLGVTYLGTAALCASKTTNEPELAYELLEFLTMNKVAQKANYQNGMAVPSLKDMEDEYLAMDKLPKNKQVFMDTLKHEEKGKFLPTYYTKTTDWYDYFFSNLTKVNKGEMTAAEYCKMIQPDVQKRLEQ